MRPRVSFPRLRGAIAMLAAFAGAAHGGDFPSVAAELIGRELNAIRAEHRAPLEWKIAAAPLPLSRRDAPVELWEAWSYFRSVYRPVKRDAIADEKRMIPFQKNEPRFNAVLDRIARGENKSALDELALFQWGSWCGTGSDSMTEPMTWARWLVFLRERRLAEAVPVSLQLRSEGVAEPGEKDQPQRLRRRLLEICGIDWEKVMAGISMIPGEGDRGIEGLPYPLFAEGGWRTAEILAAEGSERGARYVLQLAGLIAAGERSEYANAVMLLLKPAGYNRKHGAFISGGHSPLERSSPDPLPADLQREAMRTLTGWLDDVDDIRTLSDIIGLLAEARSPVEREALRSLLTHWSTEVANTAAGALRKLGEETGPLRGREPARFRVLVNGKPFADRNVDQHIAMSDGSNLYGPGKTDGNGVAEIERDYFSDPKRKIAKLTFSTRSPNSDPWFAIRVPVPAKPDVETAVNIQVQPVTFVLTLPRPADFYRDKNAAVSITRLDARGDPSTDYFKDRAEWSAPVAPEIVLPGVQAGEYAVEIQVPGSAAWKSGRQKLGAAPVRIGGPLKN